MSMSVNEFLKSGDELFRKYSIKELGNNRYAFVSEEQVENFTFKGIRKIRDYIYLLKVEDNIFSLMTYTKNGLIIHFEFKKLIRVYEKNMLLEFNSGARKLISFNRRGDVDLKFEDDEEDDYYKYFVLNLLKGNEEVIERKSLQILGTFEDVYLIDDGNFLAKVDDGYVFVSVENKIKSKTYSDMFEFMFEESNTLLIENEDGKKALLNADTLEESKWYDDIECINDEFVFCRLNDELVVVRVKDFVEASFNN